MQTALLCLCLCLCQLSTALSTPVPPPLPGRAAGNCAGQHRILLKGCNTKHGFYVFKYVYSFSTRRNQTQIEKEEAASQTTGTGHQPGEDNARPGTTEDGAAPERGGHSGADATENGTGLKTENRSTPGLSRDAHGPHPGSSTWAHSGVSAVGPTLASSEGSGDLDFVVEVDRGVSILPQGEHPSGAVAGNRSSIRDKDEGAPGRVLEEGAMTAGMERAPTTGGAGDEGSGEATVPGRGQEGSTQGTVMGGAALASVTEKMEDVQVDAKGMDEYAYIPDSGSVTITKGKVGSTAGDTSFTQISPDADDEVNIFIGRANIHMGEQETTLAGATAGSKDDSIPAAGTSSPMPRMGVTAAHDDDDGNGIPAQGQPEGLATTATPSHVGSVTSSPGDRHPTGDDDGATTVGDGEGPVAPGPWRVTGGAVTVPTGAGSHGANDKEARGSGPRFRGRLGRPAATTSPQRGDKQAAATVPARRAGIRLGTTAASPGVSERDCTTALRLADGHGVGRSTASTVAGRGGSGEAGPASPQPHRESQPGAGARVRPGGAGLEKPPGMDKAPSPGGEAGSQAPSRAPARAGSSGDGKGRLRATEAGGSPPLQAGRARGSAAAGESREQGRGGQAGAVGPGASSGRLPGRRGRRPGAAAPGAFAALGRSRQVDQVKRADELHVREQAFYTLGRARGSPRGPYASLGSADSSRSSEGETGSRSDSRQEGLRPSGWGAPGHPPGRWSQGAL